MTPGAFPAVVVPSGSKTGFSADSFSTVVSLRMLSSRSSSPTGTISSPAGRHPRPPPRAPGSGRPRRPGTHGRFPARARRATPARPCDPVERRSEPVEHHVVEQLAVPEPVAEARLRQQVGRVRHRFHASGHDHVMEPGADHQVGELDRADRRGAHLVDRVGRDLLRDSRGDRGLTRRRLARARLEHLAHEDVADLGGIEAARSSAALIAITPSSVAGRSRARRRACRTACARPRRSRSGPRGQGTRAA